MKIRVGEKLPSSELFFLNQNNEVKKIFDKFSKNKKSEVITLSVRNKKSISKIKAKLLSYVPQ